MDSTSDYPEESGHVEEKRKEKTPFHLHYFRHLSNQRYQYTADLWIFVYFWGHLVDSILVLPEPIFPCRKRSLRRSPVTSGWKWWEAAVLRSGAEEVNLHRKKMFLWGFFSLFISLRVGSTSSWRGNRPSFVGFPTWPFRCRCCGSRIFPSRRSTPQRFCLRGRTFSFVKVAEAFCTFLFFAVLKYFPHCAR